jgi:hypothetical protein
VVALYSGLLALARAAVGSDRKQERAEGEQSWREREEEGNLGLHLSATIAVGRQG